MERLAKIINPNLDTSGPFSGSNDILQQWVGAQKDEIIIQLEYELEKVIRSCIINDNCNYQSMIVGLIERNDRYLQCQLPDHTIGSTYRRTIEHVLFHLIKLDEWFDNFPVQLINDNRLQEYIKKCFSGVNYIVRNNHLPSKHITALEILSKIPELSDEPYSVVKNLENAVSDLSEDQKKSFKESIQKAYNDNNLKNE